MTDDLSTADRLGLGGSEPALDDAQRTRRDFLLGLGRWSKVVIGAACFGGLALPSSTVQAGWLNRRGTVVGGSWANAYGGGGTWANRRGGGGWINRR